MTARAPAIAATAPTSPLDRIVVLGVGIAVADATLAQGAFDSRQTITVLLLVAVATVARAAIRGRPVGRAVLVPAACWVLFALWSLASGALHGDVRAADLGAPADG